MPQKDLKTASLLCCICCLLLTVSYKRGATVTVAVSTWKGVLRGSSQRHQDVHLGMGHSVSEAVLCLTCLFEPCLCQYYFPICNLLCWQEWLTILPVTGCGKWWHGWAGAVPSVRWAWRCGGQVGCSTHCHQSWDQKPGRAALPLTKWSEREKKSGRGGGREK